MGYLIAALLILLGVWQHLVQKKNLSALTEGETNGELASFRAFLIRQARRRMQTGLLLVLTGAAIIAGLLIVPQIHPNLLVCAWLLSMVFLVWAILLMIVDIIEIRLRLNEEKSVRQAALKGLEYLRKRNKSIADQNGESDGSEDE